VVDEVTMQTLMRLNVSAIGSDGSMGTVHKNQLTIVALLAVVTVLMVAQVPLDLRTRRLSRRATTWAAVVVSIIVVVDAWVGGAFETATLSLISAMAVIGVYSFLHHVSPRSLGWGDVLLVAPLTLAVAYVSIDRVLLWQLVAATSGAVHAVWVRVRCGSSYVPFGPHLLFGAWLMLLISV